MATGGITAWGDGVDYYQIAQNLYEQKGFSRHDSAPYFPDSIRTPAYPLYILAFLMLFGKSAPIIIIIFVQCILASLAMIFLLKFLDSINQSI